jgi:hypothetical protein
MKNELKDEIIACMTQKILSTLQRQEFADWYADGGRFDAYLGDGPEMEKEFGTQNYRVAEVLIMQDIQRLFNLV